MPTPIELIEKLTPEQRWRLAEKIYASVPGTTFKTWSPAQENARTLWVENQLSRILLFYPTGKGKSKTALGLLYAEGYREVVVIAPLKAHPDWKEDARLLGMNARVETVEKFRRENSLYKKDVPIVADEFHMFGGHTAIGWKKLNRMATKLQAPLIMMSATPNYNDAERVFCIQSIGRREPNRNYKGWLYSNFETKENPFSPLPYVEKPIHFDNATEMLKAEPYVAYIEDDAVWKTETLKLWAPDSSDFERLGYSRRHHRVVNSLMEKYHKGVSLKLINERGLIWNEILVGLFMYFAQHPERKKWLIFCNHKDVANALYRSVTDKVWLIDGDTENHDEVKREFIRSSHGFLIGTTALATGVDGIDKVCQSMLILDDVRGDASKRRQLIGRILPRGTDDGVERLVVTAIFE